MARDEHDREDLLAEAKTLVERVRLRLAGYEQPAVVGFRRDSSVSFFFGDEPVYQFTSTGKLRRAYFDRLLYKAEHGHLVSLRRRRTPTAVELVHHKLTAAEATAFISTMRQHLDALRSSLITDTFDFVGEVPVGAGVVDRIRRWLGSFTPSGQIATSPRAG